jgi:PAS domain S-box-containing protein/putative nucleotidyltransferase with HDIG domain
MEALHLLLVEDSRDDVIFLTRELEKAGFDLTYKRVDTPDELRHALNLEAWDLIISDYKMPGFYGLDVLNIVHEFDLDVPLIVVTGTIGEETAVKLMKSGAHDYLMKDNLARLAPVVKRELNEAALRRERRKAISELQRSEERFRSLVENSQAGIFIIDRDEKFSYVNDMLYEILGYPRDEIIGSNFRKILSEETRERVLCDDMWSQGDIVHSSDEVWVVRRDRTRRCVELSASVISDSEGNPQVIGQMLDITERKQAEHALSQSEERLRLIVESADDILVMQDLEGRYLYYNAAVRYGLSAEDVLGMTPYDFFDEGTASFFMERMKRVVATGESISDESKVDWGGEDIWMSDQISPVKDDDGNVTAVVTITRNITEKKMAEEALLVKGRAIGSSINAIAIAGMDGKLTFVNESFRQLWGIPDDEEIEGLQAVDFWQSKEQANQVIDALIENGSWIGEMIALRWDGSTFHAQLSANIILGNNGQPLYMMASFIDVTEWVKAEAALKVSEERYKLATSAGKVGVWEWDLNTGDIYISPNLKAMLGYEEMEIEDKYEVWLSLFHPEDVKMVDETLNAFVEGRLTVIDVEARMLCKDGKERWASLRGTLIKDEDGNPVRLVGTDTDVTDARWLLESLKRRDDVLQAVNIAAERFLESPDLTTEVDVVLETLGKATGVDRVSIFRNHTDEGGKLLTSQQSEWAAPGVKSEINNPYFSNIDAIESGYGGWIEKLERGEPIFGITVDFPAHERTFLEMRGVQSVAIMPIFVRKEWWGYINFAMCRREHLWSTTERESLQTAARLLGTAIEHQQAEDALRESQNRYRNLFEDSPISLWEEDFSRAKKHLDNLNLPPHLDLRTYLWEHYETVFRCRLLTKVMDVNQATLALFKAESKEELITNIRSIYGDGNFEVFRDELLALMAGQTMYTADLNLKNLDGEPLRASYRLVIAPGYEESWGKVILSVMDITERIQAESKVKRQLDKLHALHTIDIAISSSHDLNVILNVILDQVMMQFEIDVVNVLLLNQHMPILEYAVGRGIHDIGSARRIQRVGDGFAGQVALERRVMYYPSLEETSEDIAGDTLIADNGYKGYYAAPLIAKGQVKGVLEIFQQEPLIFDQEALDFLETLADQTAIAIDNITLFNDLQRSNTELILAYDATIEGWSRALDLRDRETEGHTQRVTEMTLQLAREMGMTESDLLPIRWGALLHDIGKMGVPDTILHKPGSLDEAEWDIMHNHPVFAYEMLSPIEFLREAIDIPYCHHEYWDGSGYPRGLKGEQIPLASRIFTVVDTYDALRSDRSYRDAWSSEEVLKHIKSLAGEHFDPHVVDVFMEMIADRSEDLPD